MSISMAPMMMATRGEPQALAPNNEQALSFAAMGGTVHLRVAYRAGSAAQASRDLRRVARRVDAWAARLSRFRPGSDLSDLNRDPATRHSRVRPTLGVVLERSVGLRMRTEGLVDIGLLGARLAAQVGSTDVVPAGRWTVFGRGRRRVVERGGEVRFDLDGVAKGWIADRALALLRAYPAAMVDADGDVALRLSAPTEWRVAIADPVDDEEDLAVLVAPDYRMDCPIGVATSGTSVHRWAGPGGETHHVIDPRTGRSAQSDVVQATVVAESALVAEALAKAAIIAGSSDGLELLDRSGAWAAVLRLDSGDTIASEATLEWLA